MLARINPREGEDGWNDLLRPAEHGCNGWYRGRIQGWKSGCLGSASAPIPQRGDLEFTSSGLSFLICDKCGELHAGTRVPQASSSVSQSGRGEGNELPAGSPPWRPRLLAGRLGILLRRGPLPPSTTVEQMRSVRLLPRHRWYHLPQVP